MERYIQVDKKSADAVPCAKIDSKVDDLGETQSSQEGANLDFQLFSTECA